MSTAMQQRQQTEGRLSDWVKTDEARQQISAAVANIMDPDTFITHVLVAFQNPKVRHCSVRSQAVALMELAALGLLPTLGQVVLVPYKDTIKCTPQWQGYKAVMERHPAILEVTATLVHVNDSFGFKNGVVAHEFDPLDPLRTFTKPADIRGGYATIYYRDGRLPKYHIVTAAHITKCQRCAQTQEVWGKWYEQMALKTIYRDCYARRAVPVDPLVYCRMEKLVASDDAVLGNDPRRDSVALQCGGRVQALTPDTRGDGIDEPAPDEPPFNPPTPEEQLAAGPAVPQPAGLPGDDAGSADAAEPPAAAADDFILDEWLEAINAADTIGQVREIVGNAKGIPSPHDRERVIAACAKREEAIRGSRGDRSNGVAAEPKPGDPLEWTRQVGAGA